VLGRAFVVLAVIVVGVVWWTRRRRPHTTGDVVPVDTSRREELVDRASEESFPASDPPSYWGRETG
jgi:hypothetical protein